MYVLKKTSQSTFSEGLDSNSLSSTFDLDLSTWNAGKNGRWQGKVLWGQAGRPRLTQQR